MTTLNTPEPGTILLAGLGLEAVARRRAKRAAAQRIQPPVRQV